MWLNNADFAQVIATTPLVSIDLIIRNKHGQVLLGHRCNRPAQGYWFVPGGRIQKDERIDVAFNRLTRVELGHSMAVELAKFCGVYQHFYDDNMFGTSGSTHYLVLAYELFIDDLMMSALPAGQHENYRWFEVDALLFDDCVHDNTKDYFRSANCYGMP